MSMTSDCPPAAGWTIGKNPDRTLNAQHNDQGVPGWRPVAGGAMMGTWAITPTHQPVSVPPPLTVLPAAGEFKAATWPYARFQPCGSLRVPTARLSRAGRCVPTPPDPSTGSLGADSPTQPGASLSADGLGQAGRSVHDDGRGQGREPDGSHQAGTPSQPGSGPIRAPVRRVSPATGRSARLLRLSAGSRGATGKTATHRLPASRRRVGRAGGRPGWKR